MPKPHQSKTDQGDILIVDDETANLKLLIELLSREGYQVCPADRPHLAINSIAAQPPAFILLVERIPDVDGFEVCKRLKQDERTCDNCEFSSLFNPSRAFFTFGMLTLSLYDSIIFSEKKILSIIATFLPTKSFG
jgi:CheY-like chemotaxis protein